MVSLLFGAGAVVCLVPHSCSSKEADEVLTLLYAIVTPMLNPIIDGLRSGEVQGAIRRAPRGGGVTDVRQGCKHRHRATPTLPAAQTLTLTDPAHVKGSGAPGAAWCWGGAQPAAPHSSSPRHPVLRPVIAQGGPRAGDLIHSIRPPPCLTAARRLQEARLKVQPRAGELCLIPPRELGILLPVWSTAEVFTLSSQWQKDGTQCPLETWIDREGLL